MTRDNQYHGYGGTPIALRTNRQTEDTTRYTQKKQPPPAYADDEDENPDAWTVEKPHSSAVRYEYPVTTKRKTVAQPGPYSPKKTRVVRQRHTFFPRLLLIMGLLLLLLVLGIMAFTALSTWWQVHTDDVTYGRPRTYQTDQYVRHGDSLQHPDHFIAVNLNGIVEVVEINTQNIRLDHAYYITTTDNPLNPVTLTFPTINGKQYIYVSIGDSNPYTVIMVNDGKEFVGAQH